MIKLILNVNLCQCGWFILGCFIDQGRWTTSVINDDIQPETTEFWYIYLPQWRSVLKNQHLLWWGSLKKKVAFDLPQIFSLLAGNWQGTWGERDRHVYVYDIYIYISTVYHPNRANVSVLAIPKRPRNIKHHEQKTQRSFVNGLMRPCSLLYLLSTFL